MISVFTPPTLPTFSFPWIAETNKVSSKLFLVDERPIRFALRMRRGNVRTLLREAIVDSGGVVCESVL